MLSFTLHNSLTTYLTKTQKDCSPDVFQFTVPPEKKFGDICINIFPAVKATKMPPHILAKEILDHMTQENFVTKGEIQGGFVNLFVTDEFYLGELNSWKLSTFEKKNETIIVDYMGANIGKPLHIGHLCTPLFGQATINLLRLMGYEVIADMHQGDWGGIFGKLITGWKYFGNEEEFATDPIKHLFEIYVKITAKIEEEKNAPLLKGLPTEEAGDLMIKKDPGLKIEQECRNTFKLLSEGDEDSMKLWQRFTDKSLEEVRNVMNEFGAKPDIWVGESFYEGLPLPKLGDWPDLEPDNNMSAVVDELVEKGIATKNEDNSVGIVFNKSTNLPSCILQKKDGTHGYLASDLASIKYRIRNWNPRKILYFVDNRQALHFRQLFAAAQATWMKEASPQNPHPLPLSLEGEGGGVRCELTHAANGFVSLPEGAMSTRHGRVVFLRDLITESFNRVKKILVERKRNIGDADIKSIALGAIVYSFISQDRERDWIFDWDKVLAFEGNSGPYLQYTYVRWKKILHENKEQSTINNQQSTSLSSYDRDLITDILGFNQLVLDAGETYKFHLIVAHLATMSRHLNALYVNTPKIKDTPEDERAMRLHIVSTCLSIIEYVSHIVNIPLPEEM